MSARFHSRPPALPNPRLGLKAASHKDTTPSRASSPTRATPTRAERTLTAALAATPTPPANAEEADRAAAAAMHSEFAKPADDATIERTVAAMRDKGYTVHVVEDAAVAKELIVSLVPEGA